ncbi:response regulator transcription factor [Mesorhizobium australicum]|uniref:response regulator transcription factor n=1 Tax=Mesorhizobium australicum TaxID=536018 RepID=UPI00333ABC9D
MHNELILIVEHNEALRSSVKGHLSQVGFRTVCASDGVVGLSHFRLLKPDLVVLGDELPRKDGFEVLNEIRRYSDTPVIMTSVWNTWSHEHRCLTLGADNFMQKPYDHHVLTQRIKKLLRRGGSRANRLVRVGKLTIDPDAHSACVDAPTGVKELKLTNTEYNLLAHMARFPSRVFSRGDLIDGCFSDDGPLETTLNTHMHNLRGKLTNGGIGDYLKCVRGIGYRLEDKRG